MPCTAVQSAPHASRFAGSHRPDGMASIRPAAGRALHQQERLADVEPERGVERHRPGVEGILDEAHAHGITCLDQGGLHQPPSDAAALHSRIAGDRPDAADRITLGPEVAADHPPVQISDHAIGRQDRDEGRGELRSRLRRGEIPREAMLVRDAPEGLEDDAPAGLCIGRCGRADLRGHRRLPVWQSLACIGVDNGAASPTRFPRNRRSGKRDSEPDRDEGKGAGDGGPLHRRQSA